MLREKLKQLTYSKQLGLEKGANSIYAFEESDKDMRCFKGTATATHLKEKRGHIWIKSLAECGVLTGRKITHGPKEFVKEKHSRAYYKLGM